MGKRPRQTGLLGQVPEPDRHFSGGQRHLEAAPTHLLFQIGQLPGPIVTIGAKVQEQLMLGRDDPPTAYVPEINLTPYGAADLGVSRRHMTILLQDNILYVQDMNSRNGSKLNDESLKPGDQYPLNDGDVLMLGGLQVTVWYVD